MLSVDNLKELNLIWNSRYKEEDYFIFFMERLNENRKYFIKREAEEIIGCYLVEDTYLILHDKKIKTSKILSVIDNTPLFEDVLEYVGRDTLVTLMPVDEQYENKYGFEVVGRKSVYRISGVDIPDFPIRNIVIDPPITALYQVYTSFTSYFNGYETYTHSKFEEYITRYKQQGAEIIGYEESGVLIGYAVYSKNKYLVDIIEICYESANTLLQMISYLTKGIGYIQLSMSNFEQLTRIIPSARFTKEDILMARINDKELFERLYGIKILGSYSGFHAFGKPVWNQRNL